jgi:DnaJ like chaperone protein
LCQIPREIAQFKRGFAQNQAPRFFKRNPAESRTATLFPCFRSVLDLVPKRSPPHTRHLKQVLLVYLIVMALADGHIHQAEESLLADIATRLGYDQATFRQLIDMVLNQTHFAGGKPSTATALDDAYKALGVTKENTDQEIKRAYRKLISQYHPDKLIGQGLPEDMIAMATEQAKEIQLAYDLLKQSRNI